MKKYIIFGIVLILLCSVVYADKIIQTSTGEEGQLGFLYPSLDKLSLGQDFHFYFHLANSSGYIMPNSEANCTMHVYSPLNNYHILETNISVSEIKNDFEYEFNHTLFNETGSYEYNIWCNASNGEYGYVSDFFEINLPYLPYYFYILIIIGWLLLLSNIFKILRNKLTLIVGAWITLIAILIFNSAYSVIEFAYIIEIITVIYALGCVFITLFISVE